MLWYHGDIVKALHQARQEQARPVAARARRAGRRPAARFDLGAARPILAR